MMQKKLLSSIIFLGIITSSCSNETSTKSHLGDSVNEITNVPENNVENDPTSNTAYDTSELSFQYTCNPETHIYAQVPVPFEEICQSLTELEVLFFEHFGSTPILGDHNNNRDLYIYKDRESYLAQDFNVSSYGKYIEKDPNDIDSHGEIYSYLLDNGNVKNQNHEYIHYLDGRFNKEGDYYATDMAAWWTEGVAEYMQHLHWGVASTFIKESIKYYGGDFSLKTIFSLTKSDYKTDYFNLVYDGGNVALCFFLQEEPEAISTLLSYSRSGNWSAWASELDKLSTVYGESFDAFVKDIFAGKKVCHLNDHKAA